MIRLIEDMPAGTLGVEAGGTVTHEEYEHVLVPAVRAALERDDGVRVLLLLGDDLDAQSSERMRAEARSWAAQPKKWKRIAVVTDHDGVGSAVRNFGWLAPAPVRRFAAGDLAAAKGWLAR